MREWLSGGVSPCQGEGRGFESRLALERKTQRYLKIGVSEFFYSERMGGTYERNKFVVRALEVF